MASIGVMGAAAQACVVFVTAMVGSFAIPLSVFYLISFML